MRSKLIQRKGIIRDFIVQSTYFARTLPRPHRAEGGVLPGAGGKETAEQSGKGPE